MLAGGGDNLAVLVDFFLVGYARIRPRQFQIVQKIVVGALNLPLNAAFKRIFVRELRLLREMLRQALPNSEIVALNRGIVGVPQIFRERFSFQFRLEIIHAVFERKFPDAERVRYRHIFFKFDILRAEQAGAVGKQGIFAAEFPAEVFDECAENYLTNRSSVGDGGELAFEFVENFQRLIDGRTGFRAAAGGVVFFSGVDVISQRRQNF